MWVIPLAAQHNTLPCSSQTLMIFMNRIKLHGRNYAFYFYFSKTENLIFYFIAQTYKKVNSENLSFYF